MFGAFLFDRLLNKLAFIANGTYLAADKIFPMAYPASVIAYAFVKKGIEEGAYVTQMKLQKMAYFAHGYHLAKYGQSLVEEEFEAWKFGPVVQSIYQDYKLYGSDSIIGTGLISSGVKKLEEAELNEAAKDAVEYTWKLTKNLSASQLSKWSHRDGSPWAEVYEEGFVSNPIKNETIQEYFKRILSKPSAAA